MASTDWDICALCQKEGDEGLRDPCKSRNGEHLKTFETLEQNLKTLSSMNALPLNIKLDRLKSEGQGIKETLKLHKAKWHKKCYVLCSNVSVKRVNERTKQLMQVDVPAKRQCLRTNVEGSKVKQNDENTCFFCTEPMAEHKLSTIDAKLRDMAIDLGDDKILRQLAGADMTTSDFSYHKKCLTNFHTRHRSWQRHCASRDQPDVDTDSIAFEGIISHIEQQHKHGHSHHKLNDLMKLYTEQAGGEGTVHCTRLKQRILNALPDLEEHKCGKEIMLSFKDCVAKKLQNANEAEDEDFILMQAAKLIRKDMLEKKYEFSGSFDDEQYDDLPLSLIKFLQMLLMGYNTNHEIDEGNCAVSTLAQLIIFNSIQRKKNTQFTRHNHNRETAFPLYLGLQIHNKTRRKDLIDELHQVGLSISYDRVIQIQTQTANGVIDRFVQDGVVCPTSLRFGILTTGQLDNIDHNTSATSAQSSFHGTSISLTQHVGDNEGINRFQSDNLITEASKHRKTIQNLPESYVQVPSVKLPKEDPKPKKLEPIDQPAILHDQKSQQWLSSVSSAIKDEARMEKPSNISFSAYFAANQVAPPKRPAISGLLPLFRNSSHSTPMIKHGMDIIKQATSYLNPGQTPVITLDQPLFAIAKKIQWTWPQQYGEELYLVMMGGLHIEMCFLNVLGDLCEGSGLATAISRAGITTEGRVDAVMKGSQTSRGQWVHQVTACALFELQSIAYLEYEAQTENCLPFTDWAKQKSDADPQFYYWSRVLDKELLF